MRSSFSRLNQSNGSVGYNALAQQPLLKSSDPLGGNTNPSGNRGVFVSTQAKHVKERIMHRFFESYPLEKSIAVCQYIDMVMLSLQDIVVTNLIIGLVL